MDYFNTPILDAYVNGQQTQMYVWCRHCTAWHMHSVAEGHRNAHCFVPGSPYKETGYILRYAGLWTDEIRLAIHENREAVVPVPAPRGVPLIPSQRFAILQRDTFHCTYCGRGREDGVKLHVDHIIPRSKGGTNDPENLTTACQDCNLGKAARDL